MNHGWSLEDWVILDNHYHIMVNAPEVSANPAKLVAEYHRFTALFIRKINPEFGTLRKFFNNYWDTCITFEKSFYSRLNYIYNNPVKHGYVNNAQDYQWGSFRIRYAKDRSYVEKMFDNFPYDSVNVADDF
jgi:putative transposase